MPLSCFEFHTICPMLFNKYNPTATSGTSSDLCHCLKYPAAKPSPSSLHRRIQGLLLEASLTSGTRSLSASSTREQSSGKREDAKSGFCLVSRGRWRDAAGGRAGPQVDQLWTYSSLPDSPGFSRTRTQGHSFLLQGSWTQHHGLRTLEPHAEGGPSRAWLQQRPGACWKSPAPWRGGTSVWMAPLCPRG